MNSEITFFPFTRERKKEAQFTKPFIETKREEIEFVGNIIYFISTKLHTTFFVKKCKMIFFISKTKGINFM